MLRYGAVCVTPAHRGQCVGLLLQDWDHWTEETEEQTTQPDVHLAGSLEAPTHPSRQTGQVPPLASKCCFRHPSQNQCPQWVGLHASRRSSEQIGQNHWAPGCASNTRLPGSGSASCAQMTGQQDVSDASLLESNLMFDK